MYVVQPLESVVSGLCTGYYPYNLWLVVCVRDITPEICG